MSTPTLFEQFGGEAFFASLVSHFYAGVAADPVLRPMYPEADLGPAARRLQLFLEQYWGGPTTYSEERGHPRLRMRHAPFPIDLAARERWLHHMGTALAATETQFPLEPGLRAELWAYLESAATAMVNTYDDQTGLPLT